MANIWDRIRTDKTEKAMTASERPAPNKGIEAMRQASRIAQKKGNADITLEEINAEIAAVREGK